MIYDVATSVDEESDGVVAENAADKTDLKMMWNTPIHHQRLYWQCQAR